MQTARLASLLVGLAVLSLCFWKTNAGDAEVLLELQKYESIFVFPFYSRPMVPPRKVLAC